MKLFGLMASNIHFHLGTRCGVQRQDFQCEYQEKKGNKHQLLGIHLIGLKNCWGMDSYLTKIAHCTGLIQGKIPKRSCPIAIPAP